MAKGWCGPSRVGSLAVVRQQWFARLQFYSGSARVELDLAYEILAEFVAEPGGVPANAKHRRRWDETGLRGGEQS